MPIKEYDYDKKSAQPMIAAEPVMAYSTSAMQRAYIYTPTPTELASIKRGEEQVARGEFYTEQQMDKMMDEWLS